MKKEQAYRIIKRLIFDKKWDPQEAINVNEIANQLQMSRTPIHKALTQLGQEGLLTIIPQVGVFVKKPKHSEIIERILVSANLDSLLTEQATPKISEEKIEYLQNLLIKMDQSELSPEEYTILNSEFHRTIYDASELEYTIGLAKQNWDFLNFVGKPEVLFSKFNRERSQKEHWMIFYTIKDRDSKFAKRLMENHMRRVAISINE
ncbi:GntR family transcriptional regulator [Cytobacillus kochii]